MPRSKNSGELLTTTTRGSFDALPAQLRAALTVITERQAVNLDATPETLSNGVIESGTLMDQTNEFKKQTIRSSAFPITLTSTARSDEHGGGTITITDTFSLTVPTAPTGSLTIIDHGIANLGLIYHEHKEEKTTASWPVLSGQQYDETTGVVVQFTEQITAPGANLGDALTEITPIDNTKQRVRVWVAPTAALDALSDNYPTTVRLNLPDVLVGLTVTYNEVKGDGAESHPVASQNAQFFGSGSASIRPRASASASVSIIPDLQPIIRSVWASDVPATVYLFYMPRGSTQSEILTKLATLAGATVNPWPVFRPESHVFTLKGGQMSVRLSADSSASVSGGPESTSYEWEKGSGYSTETSATVRTVLLPPTIHGVLGLTGNASQTAAATVSVDASTVALYRTIDGVSGVIVPAMTNAPTPRTAEVTAEVTPTSLLATQGTSAIPTTGLYLLETDSSPYKWEYNVLRCVVVNFSYFA